MSKGLSNILLQLVSFSTGLSLLFALFSLFFFSPAHFKNKFLCFSGNVARPCNISGLAHDFSSQCAGTVVRCN